MRDLLTGLAIVLIVILTTLLVAPYFVDWNSQRGFLEAQLSRAFGQKVTIGGAIDLKLLPTPYLRLTQTVIGGDDAPMRIGIRHLDFELAVAPLLHGEIDIIEGRLEQPVLRLALLPDRSLPALPGSPAARFDVRLERVAIVDGTIAIADPASGRTFSADHIDGTVEAPDLGGPYKGSGTQGQGSARTRFRFSTAPARRAGKESRTRLRFGLDETALHPGLDLDGDVILIASGDGIAESFNGTVSVNGRLRPAGRAPIDWHLSGPLRAGTAAARFGGGEFRLGREDAALTFAAEAQINLDGAPRAEAKLVARQLDVDRLSAPPAAAGETPGTVAAPPRLPDLAALRHLAAAATPPLPVAVDASVETAIWGGQTLSALEARFVLGGAAPQPFHFAADGPGGLHLALDAAPGGTAGHVDVAAADLPTVLGWARQILPSDVLPVLVPTPFRQASLGGRYGVRDAALSLDDLALQLDRTALRGSMRLDWPDRVGAPIAVAADLSTAALDLDALPALPSGAPPAAAGQQRLDLALKLDAASVKIAEAGSGPLTTGRLHLEGRRAAGQLRVDAFSIADLGGAALRGSGALAEEGASIDLDIDAARVDAAAAVFAQLAPGRVADALARRAPSLAPAKLHLAADLKRDGKGQLIPARIDAGGRLALTTLEAHVAPEGGGAHLRVLAETPQGEELLRQIGLPIVSPTRPLGTARFSLDGSGPLGGPLRTRVEAAVGGSHLGVDGAFQLFGTGRGGSGTLTVATPDAVPLLQALGLASTDAEGLLPAVIGGGLALTGTSAAVSDLRGSVAGDGVGGTLRWRFSEEAAPDAPALTGSLDLDRLALGDVAALLLGPPRAVRTGASWSSEPFAAGLAAMPSAQIRVRAGALALRPGAIPTATDATLDLDLAPDVITLKHLGATLGGGRLEAEGALRRDDKQATLAGSLSLTKAALAIPAARAGVDLKLRIAGGGPTPLALVSSLAGAGEATLADATLPGEDAKALPAIFADTESDALAVDAESIRRAFLTADTGKDTLKLGTLPLEAGLASGLLTLGPGAARRQDAPVRIGAITAALTASYDLRSLDGGLAVKETLAALPKDWSGPPPSLVVRLEGLPGDAKRSVDVGDFVNAVASRAIARETARIEAFEFDVRERALFNARLLYDRRREQDRRKADADARAAAEAARQAEAERRAKLDAASAGLPEQLPQPGPLPGPLPRTLPTPPDPSTAGRY